MKLGFCGLGLMGAPMVRRLLAAGHQVQVWNRSAAKAEALAAHVARVVGSAREAASGVDGVLMCLFDAHAVEAVVFGADGVAEATGLRWLADHSSIDPAATRTLAARLAQASGADWIDDAARAARAVLTTTELPVVVGHFDWRVQNLAFDGNRVAAIYDWDSIHLGPEAAVVGSASVIHPVDWRRDLADPLPSPAQVEAFVRDYEAARGTPFDGAELAVLRAAQRWTASYGARCQHSDQQLDVFPDVDHSHGWPRLLRELLALLAP